MFVNDRNITILAEEGFIYEWYITFTINIASVWVLISILSLSALVSTLYWLVLFIKLSFYKESIRYGNFPFSSILISAKNEAENLKNHLPSVLNQKNIRDVIVMNDYSTDRTMEVLDSLAANSQNLRHYRPSKDHKGKKLALTEGIGKCSSAIVVLTDADCHPVSERWAECMAQKIVEDTELVLGYGPLEKESGLLNSFARFETVITAIQYFGYSLLKIPYMGVGRNLAFTKDLFTRTAGYASHEHIASGDDDLFVQEARKHTQISICLSPESFMYSRAPQSLAAYIRQKKRHVATATSYTLIHKVLLGLHPFMHLLTVSMSLLLVYLGLIKMVCTIWLIRWVLLAILGYIPFKRLDGDDLIKWIPLLDMLLVAYYIYFGWSAITKKNASW